MCLSGGCKNLLIAVEKTSLQGKRIVCPRCVLARGIAAVPVPNWFASDLPGRPLCCIDRLCVRVDIRPGK